VNRAHARVEIVKSWMDPVMVLQIVSPAFSDGGRIPRNHSCDGADRSPPLSWSGLPEGCLSLVLLCDDPDAPAGTWHHWAAYDIPAGETGLDEDFPKSESVGPIRQALNDFRRIGYSGPCPPRGHGPHHYRFRLLALSVEHLGLPARPNCRNVERAAVPHRIAEAILVGIYER
jgi:Raf kinase inhibitor-like YbhB/YbcL family protein